MDETRIKSMGQWMYLSSATGGITTAADAVNSDTILW